MGDEQKAHTFFGFQFCQKIQNLGLNCHIKRGGGFVSNKQVGFVRKRHRNHYALALAAGKLMWVAGQTAFGVTNADLVQQLDNPTACVRTTDPLMHHQAFCDLLFQRVQRVQRCHRFLENETDVVSSDTAQFRFVNADHLCAIVFYTPINFGVFRKQRHRAQCGHRLPRT